VTPATFADPALHGDAALEAAVRATVDRVEETLREAVRSADPVLAETARHLVDAGGKRFRPLLTALVAQLGDGGSDEVVLAGTVVELTHLATLYHDDVMDEAPVRRGATSSSPARPTSPRGWAPRRCASRPRPSPAWSRARSPRRWARAERTRSSTTYG
jgi:hypothetical protein